MATTTQFVDARTRDWATGCCDELEIPTRLLPPMVEPGVDARHAQGRRRAPALAGTPVVAPACHDTGSAVASVFGGGGTAFISSGTWSLLGTEVPAPVITPRARDLNFTNEGGVCGTTRLLKNIGGLWLLQACRRSWAAHGPGLRVRRAAVGRGGDERPRVPIARSIPTIRGSCNPPDMAGGDCRVLPADRPARARRRRRRSRARSSRASRSSTAWCSNRSRS